MLLLAGLAAVAVAFALFTFPANEDAVFPGYMEADLVLVGSEQGGRVAALSVEEGAHVKQGDPIFVLESEEQEASVAAARARVQEAEARLADAKARTAEAGRDRGARGRARPGARPCCSSGNNNLDRARALFDKGWTTKAQLDDAIAQHDRNEAAVAEAEKRITAAKLPGRSDMIDAAAANAEAARHALIEAEKNLGKRQVLAPADGTVEEVYFRPGEVVNAGQAVVALLPPRNLKVRFFVAEPVRAGLQVDQTISRHLRRLPAGPPRQDQLHRARGGVHAAGDLLARAAAEARLPRRGAARGRGERAHRRPAGDGDARARRNRWCGDERDRHRRRRV